jgi:hypothetical protein
MLDERFPATLARAVHADVCLERDHNVRICVVRIVRVARKRVAPSELRRNDTRATAHRCDRAGRIASEADFIGDG